MKRTLVVACALAALLSACSDSDEDGKDDKPKTSDSSAPAATDASPSADTETTPQDQAMVEASVLTLEDFEPGWTAEPADDDEDREGKEKIAECVGVAYEDMYNDDNAFVESPDFTSPNDEQVSNAVGLAGSEAWMTSVFQITAGDKFRQCLVDGMVDEMSGDEDVTVGEIALKEMSFEQVGDESTAFRLSIPLASGGMDFEATADFVVVRVGRGQVLTTTFAMGSPVDVEELAGYVKIGVDRLTAELQKVS